MTLAARRMHEAALRADNLSIRGEQYAADEYALTGTLRLCFVSKPSNSQINVCARYQSTIAAMSDSVTLVSTAARWPSPRNRAAAMPNIALFSKPQLNAPAAMKRDNVARF